MWGPSFDVPLDRGHKQRGGDDVIFSRLLRWIVDLRRGIGFTVLRAWPIREGVIKSGEKQGPSGLKGVKALADVLQVAAVREYEEWLPQPCVSTPLMLTLPPVVPDPPRCSSSQKKAHRYIWAGSPPRSDNMAPTLVSGASTSTVNHFLGSGIFIIGAAVNRFRSLRRLVPGEAPWLSPEEV